eukprot:5267219-Prymnesium_polylepis.1
MLRHAARRRALNVSSLRRLGSTVRPPRRTATSGGPCPKCAANSPGGDSSPLLSEVVAAGAEASSSSAAAAAEAARAHANAAGQALRDAIHSREELRMTFMQALEDRQRRLAVGSISALVVCGAIFYWNRQHAKERVVEQISDVATLTLGDQKMQAQAQQATMQTLQALLGDEATVAASVEFLSQVASHPESRRALISLLVEALKSKAVLNEALELTLWVLDDPRSREHLVDALLYALKVCAATGHTRNPRGPPCVHSRRRRCGTRLLPARTDPRAPTRVSVASRPALLPPVAFSVGRVPKRRGPICRDVARAARRARGTCRLGVDQRSPCRPHPALLL